MQCRLDCKEGYETFVKHPNPEAPENQIWSQPVAYCKKAEDVPSEKEEPKSEDMILTLHNFGFNPGSYGDINSAQAWFWYNKEKRNGTPQIVRESGYKKGGVRHFNLNPIAGTSEYEKFSTLTYKFKHYPDAPLPVKMKVRLTKNRNEHRSYFLGDPDEVNVYCQSISDDYDDRKFCVSGNIKQLNRIEAKEFGWSPDGSFTLMNKVNGVPSDDVWVEIDGSKKRLTEDLEKTLDPEGRYANVVPKSVLEELGETNYIVRLEGEDDECKITRIYEWRINADCSSSE